MPTALKQFRVLLRSGAIDVRTDSDRRRRRYFLPPDTVRDTPEGERILDYFTASFAKASPPSRRPCPCPP